MHWSPYRPWGSLGQQQDLPWASHRLWVGLMGVLVTFEHQLWGCHSRDPVHVSVWQGQRSGYNQCGAAKGGDGSSPWHLKCWVKETQVALFWKDMWPHTLLRWPFYDKWWFWHTELFFFILLSEDKVWTTVNHDLQEHSPVVSKKQALLQLNYSATMDQISAITSSAEYCEQFISYTCKMSRLLNTPGRQAIFSTSVLVLHLA